MGDAGLTGRKIIVDTYGGVARHGGGAFSGKDPTKVDRSAAYMVRYVAKNLVAAGVGRPPGDPGQLRHRRGPARSASSVETFGTGKVSDEKIVDADRRALRPAPGRDHPRPGPAPADLPGDRGLRPLRPARHRRPVGAAGQGGRAEGRGWGCKRLAVSRCEEPQETRFRFGTWFLRVDGSRTGTRGRRHPAVRRSFPMNRKTAFFLFVGAYGIIAANVTNVELIGGCLRALITGISGFVGSHLAERLLDLGDWDVAGTVYGGATNIAHLRDRLSLYQGELSDPERVQEIVEDSRPDVIFHLAAQPIPSLSRKDPWCTLENNIRLQVNVLEAVTRAAPQATVLVIGSSEEYGQVSPSDLPVTEEAPLRPTNPYAVSKIAQDYLGLQYYLSHGVRAIRMRPFNHIGPRQRRGFVAPDFAWQIAEIEAGRRPAVLLVGQLDVSRDFSDVRDIVRGYVLAATRGEAGEVYNIGACEARSVRELLETLLRHSTAEIEVRQDPERMRPVDTPVIVGDCSKLRDATGWEPRISFEQTLADVLDDWRRQVAAGIGLRHT